jgi:hypothetical protein
MVEGVGFFAARDHVIICPGRLGVIDKSISRCLVLSAAAGTPRRPYGHSGLSLRKPLIPTLGISMKITSKVPSTLQDKNTTKR